MKNDVLFMRSLIFSCFQHLSKSKSNGSASLISAGAKKPSVSNTHHGGLASRFAQLAMASDEDEGYDSSSSDEEDEAEEEQPTVEEPKSRFLQTACCGKTRLLSEPAFEELKSWRGTLDCADGSRSCSLPGARWLLVRRAFRRGAQSVLD